MCEQFGQLLVSLKIVQGLLVFEPDQSRRAVHARIAETPTSCRCRAMSQEIPLGPYVVDSGINDFIQDTHATLLNQVIIQAYLGNPTARSKRLVYLIGPFTYMSHRI